MNNNQYQEFLASKMVVPQLSGFDVPDEWLNENMYLFQSDIVKWALRLGKAAIFAQVGLGKCVTGDTLIPTEIGMIPIKELGTDSSEMVITVQTKDGNRQTSHFHSTGKNPTIKFETRYGYSLAGTYEHPVYVLDKNGYQTWKRLDQLQIGDFVAIQRDKSIFGDETELPDMDYVRVGQYSTAEKKLAVKIANENRGVVDKSTLELIQNTLERAVVYASVKSWLDDGITENANVKQIVTPHYLDTDTSYVLGALLGDGSLTQNTRIHFTSADDEIVEILSNWFSDCNVEMVYKGRYDYHVYSTQLYNWLIEVGLTSKLAHNKTIPNVIMRTNKENVKAFLQGLFDTDGSAYKNGSVEFCSSSHDIAHKVHLLLLQFGIIGRMKFKPNKKKGAWIIQLHGIEANKFYNEIGFRLSRKQNRQSALKQPFNTNVDVIPHLPEIEGCQVQNGMSYRDYIIGKINPSHNKLHEMSQYYPELGHLDTPHIFWDKVASVKDNGIQETYDLTVPDSHCFVANGVVSHNTLMQLSWAECVARQTDGHGLIFAPLAVSQQTIREAKKFGIALPDDADNIQAIENVGAYMGIGIKRVENQDDIDFWTSKGKYIFITNYERLLNKDKSYRFDVESFDFVVLDESSKLKSYTGQTKKALLDAFKNTPYKLACSATPAPNDHMELGNHAQFLDIMDSEEMLMRYFENDAMTAGGYTLKPHGEKDFWRWLTSWAVCITIPSDLGQEYDMPEFELPELHIIDHFVPATQKDYELAMKNGKLLPETKVNSTTHAKKKRQSLDARLEMCKDIVDSIDSHEPIIIWYILLDEMRALKGAFPDAMVVQGSDTSNRKEEMLLGFAENKFRILITHTKIAGMGMNYQHCNQMIFFGLDFSFESFYQAKGRIHRYGQKRDCYAHLIYSELEGNIMSTLERKQNDFAIMQSKMSEAMVENGLFRDEKGLKLMPAKNDIAQGKDWTLYLGDCIDRITEIESDSVALTVSSLPFTNLYIYSDSMADLGNSNDDYEFFQHFAYLIPELYRITRSGGIVAMHCKDLPAYMGRDGYAGLRDFPGEIIRAFELFNLQDIEPPNLSGLTQIEKYHAKLEWQRQVENRKKDSYGWRFHSRFNVWKNPEIEMQRTKNKGLIWSKTYCEDASAARQGMADYMLIFRKWDAEYENRVKVLHADKFGEFVGSEGKPDEDYVKQQWQSRPSNFTLDQYWSINTWRGYASPAWNEEIPPVWRDINPVDVLNFKLAKDSDDGKHIAPLQLDLIKRCIHLWSNKGDIVFDPFMGVGSTAYSAIEMGRKAIGIELKESYWKHSIEFVQELESELNRPNFFDLVDEVAGD